MPVRTIKIIGGADGPTAIFLAGKDAKDKNPIRRVKHAFLQSRYLKRQKKAERMISPGAHSAQETIAYMQETYGAVETDKTSPLYEKRRQEMRYLLIQRENPDLLGREAPEDLFPIDYHIYRIDRGADGCVEIEMELDRGIIETNASETRSLLRHSKMSAIARDIYLYYGVSAEDIAARSDRYRTLVSVLSTP